MTEILKPGSSLEIYEKIRKVLLEGKLVAIPTETVYGVAADATNNQAVATIFALKSRPAFNPLICHFVHLDDILQHCHEHPALRDLAREFWPGPLTLILPLKDNSSISPLVSAGLRTLAVRIPDHPVAIEVIERTQRPLAAPSANPSESISPTSATHVFNGFGEHPLLPVILDGGPCHVGVESTILDLSGEHPVILRPGSISAEDLGKVLGNIEGFSPTRSTPVRAPGMTKRHYAPRIPVRMNATSVSPDEALLVFGESNLEGGAITLNLSPTGDLVEAAANLFSMLHQIDKPEYTGIAVGQIPNTGIGIAINDRLSRASSTSMKTKF